MDDRFLRACRGERVTPTPIWIMRQAGRYLPEYREVRQRVGFVELCKTPELAARVTLQPIERFGFDAAILFSDIMIPAEPLGVRVDFNPGPIIDRPIRTASDIERLQLVDPRDELPFVYETIRILRRELRVPLIGFAAAPFTLAAYLVEGQGSRHFTQVKRLLLGDPASAHRLLDTLTEATRRYVVAQVEAGAQAIQLFDSWAGLLDPASYREFALPRVRRLVEAVREAGVPAIYFALNGAHLLDEIGECGADVLGLDWRTPLDHAAGVLGPDYTLQGNLDPCALFGSRESLLRQADDVLRRGSSARSHVFNLGHGILPETDPAQVEALLGHIRGDEARR